MIDVVPHDDGHIKQWITDSHAFKYVTASEGSMIGPIEKSKPFLSMMISGAVLIHDGRGQQVIKPGTFAIYFNGFMQNVEAIQCNTSWVLIDCPPDLMGMVRKHATRSLCARHTHPAQMAEVVRLFSEFSDMTDDRQWDFAGRIDQLFSGHFAFEGKLKSCPRSARQLRDLLHDSKNEFVGLSQAAEQIGRNVSHLGRTFRKHFGMTAGEYLRLIRFRQAFLAISQGKLPLATIALQCGFADQSHLCRTFKAYAGYTPTQYSAMLGQ